MRKINLVVVLIIGLIAMACTATQNRPTVCDEIGGPSILCQVAEKSGARLEDIGNGLILVNAVAISEGVYTKADAKCVLERLLEALDGSVTYAVFKSKLTEATESFPGLLEVAKVYLDEFSLSKQMYDADRDILRTWLTNRLKSL